MAKLLKSDLNNDKLISILKTFMIFKDLTENDIRSMLKIETASGLQSKYQNRIAKVCNYKAGEMVIREGDFDCWSFWIVKGSFEVIQNGKKFATFSKTGEIFGEMSVLEGITRTASVVSAEDGICLCMDMSILEHLEDKRVISIIRQSFYNIIKERLGKAKVKIIEEKRELQNKYENIVNFEKKIQHNFKK